MEKHNFKVIIKRAMELTKDKNCNSNTWMQICKAIYTTIVKDKDRLAIRTYLQEALVPLILNCSNDQQEIRSESEETISRIIHFSEEHKMTSFLSFAILQMIKDQDMLPRSLKICMIALKYSFGFTKRQKMRYFTEAVFFIIKTKIKDLTNAVCIEIFNDFLQSFVFHYNKFLHEDQIQELLTVFIECILVENALTRYCLSQCVSNLIKNCRNCRHNLYNEIILKSLDAFQSNKENEIIGVADILKQNIDITEYTQYHKELSNIFFSSDKIFHHQIGVINIYLELLSALLKSTNDQFRKVLIDKKQCNSEKPLFHALLENICIKFLYNESDGTLKTDVQISVQSNVLNFLISCCNLSIELVNQDNFLLNCATQLCQHNDFLMREKAVILISKLVQNEGSNSDLRRDCYTLLALAFEDSAHTVVSSLISEISDMFNKLLRIPKDNQILIQNKPFITHVMDKVITLTNGQHWLVSSKICDFYSKIDFKYMRTHFGYSVARFYQESCYTNLLQFVNSNDTRVFKHASQSIVNILSKMNTTGSEEDFETYLQNFVSNRYLFGQRKSNANDIKNLREHLGHILGNLCNSIANIHGICAVGSIHCLRMCITNMPSLSAVCFEYNMLSFVVALMTEDYTVGIDVACQVDLFRIAAVVLPGHVKEGQKTNEQINYLKNHILNIFNIYMKVISGTSDTNTEEDKLNYAHGFNETEVIYVKLLESIKNSFENNRTTLNRDLNEKTFQLLKSATSTLLVLLNLYSVESFLTLEDKIQIFVFCDISYKMIPVGSLKLLNQLIKSSNSINFEKIKPELDCISKLNYEETFANINKYICPLESKVMCLNSRLQLELDKTMEKSLKLVITQAIKYYSEMSPEEQNIVLELMCSLLFSNVVYHTLDPENLLIVKVLNQFEQVEQSMTCVPYTASKTSVRFLLIISLKKISSTVSISRVLNLVDSLLMNDKSTSNVITTVCELLISIFCNTNVPNFHDQVEINTLKEVLLHTLFKFTLNIEIMQTLPLIINNYLEPHSEKIYNYISSVLLDKDSSSNLSLWCFTLISLDCMIAQFDIPDSFLKLSFDEFMTNKFSDLQNILNSGCWLRVILNLEKSKLFVKLETYGYQKQQLVLSITKLLIKLLKAYNGLATDSRVLINYILWLKKQLKILDLRVAIHKEHFQHLSDISSKPQISNLLHLFIADSSDDVGVCILNFYEIQVQFLAIDKKPFNVSNLKQQIESITFERLPLETFHKFMSEVIKNKVKCYDVLLEETNNKYTTFLLTSYLQKKMNEHDIKTYSHLSSSNVAEWNIMMFESDLIKCKCKKERLKQHYGTNFYKLLDSKKLKRTYSVKRSSEEVPSCSTSIICGTLLLEMKTEKKVFDFFNNRNHSRCFSFYSQWINLCFSTLFMELRMLWSLNNVVLKHIEVPPFLKNLMIKLIEALSSFKSVEVNKEEQLFLSIITAMTCFFQKLYEFQLESIGKLNFNIIEKLVSETCLSTLDTRDIIACYLNVQKNTTKLDVAELFTRCINNILKSNYMWNKMEHLMANNLDLSRELWITVSSMQLAGDHMYEEAILEKINFLINKSTAQKILENHEELMYNLIRMNPFYQYLFAQKGETVFFNETGKTSCQTTSIFEYKNLENFVKRLNIYGFTNKYQYEELFTSLLILYNMESDEYSQTPVDLFRYKKLILEAICNLIVLCYHQPCIGKRDQFSLHYPRIGLLHIDSVWMKKLYTVHSNNNCYKIRNIFSLPNMERSYKERQFVTSHCYKNQGNLTDSDVYKRLNLYLNIMNFDVESSVLLLVDALSERLSQNYMEVLPSISKLIEYCTMKERYNKTFSNINNIYEMLSIHDTLSLEIIVYCLLKCYSLGETGNLTQSLNLQHLVNICLRNKQVFVRISTLNGILALLDSLYVSQITSKEEIIVVYNSVLPYINKMLKTYSEVHDCSLNSLVHFILYHDDTIETKDNYLESYLQKTTRLELLYCTLQSFESLVALKSVREELIYKLQQKCLELIKGSNVEINLVALQTLITTIYKDQLQLTEEANGLVQTDIEQNHIILEVTNRLFQLLRVSSVREAPIIGLFLYHIIIDLTRPNDLLTLVTKEFLDCYHPYPYIIGKVLHGLFRAAIDADLLPFLQDLLLSVLPTVFEISNYTDRLLRLIILFNSVSIDQSPLNNGFYIFDNIKPILFHQDMSLLTSVKKFYHRLNKTQKKSFIILCKPFEKRIIEVGTIFKQLS